MTPHRLFLHPLVTLVICAFIASACGDDAAAPPPKQPAASGGGAAAPKGGKRGKKKKTIEELKAEIQRKSPLTASIFAPITEKTRAVLKENRNPFFGFVDIRLSELQRQRDLEALQKLDASTADPIKLEPLQLFDLRQLKLTVTITDTPIPQAEVIDPNGERHPVFIGSSIGPVGGAVVDIRQGEIKILRTQQQKDGTASTTCTIMRLSLSLDVLVQATREASGEIEVTDEGGVKCNIISFYPKKLDNIKITYQD